MATNFDLPIQAEKRHHSQYPSHTYNAFGWPISMVSSLQIEHLVKLPRSEKDQAALEKSDCDKTIIILSEKADNSLEATSSGQQRSNDDCSPSPSKLAALHQSRQERMLLQIFKYRLFYQELSTWMQSMTDFCARNDQSLQDYYSVWVKSHFLASVVSKRASKEQALAAKPPTTVTSKLFYTQFWKRRYYTLLDALNLVGRDNQLLRQAAIQKSSLTPILEMKPTWDNRLLATVELDTDLNQGMLLKSAVESSEPIRNLYKHYKKALLSVEQNSLVECSVGLLTDVSIQNKIERERMQSTISLNAKLTLLINQFCQHIEQLNRQITAQDQVLTQLNYDKLINNQEEPSPLSDKLSCDQADSRVGNTKYQELQIKQTNLLDKITDLRLALRQEEKSRKNFHNQLQDHTGNIRVVCRIRPPDTTITTRQEGPLPFLWTSLEDKLFTSVKATKRSFSSKSGNKSRSLLHKSYYFDRVFNATASQLEVYNQLDNLIVSCVDGYDVCILAYGQTGSGKTYTMIGTDQKPGIMPQAMDRLMQACNSRRQYKYTIQMSVLEIYQETIIDLLLDQQPLLLDVNNSRSSNRPIPPIRIRTNEHDNVVVENVTEATISDRDQAISLLELAQKRRHTGATRLNSSSSRSHLLTIVRLKTRNASSGAVVYENSTMTLVDLAGSEQVKKSHSTGQRFAEATMINKSLTSLGRVFDALRRGQQPVYRESKLTQLLRPSLGSKHTNGKYTTGRGNGPKCILVVTLRSEYEHANESVQAIQFGQNVMQPTCAWRVASSSDRQKQYHKRSSLLTSRGDCAGKVNIRKSCSA